MDLLDVLQRFPEPISIDWTEADTRAQFIDPILEAVGWSPSCIRREPYAGWKKSKGYVDYLLLVDDKPRMVLEAKKTGRSFQIPNRLATNRQTSFKKLQDIAAPDLAEALEQCLRYAQHVGALYACATNGIDWIFFKPTHPGRSLPEAKVIVFHGIDQIRKRMDEFEDLLSASGVEQGKTEKLLLGRDIQVPTFSKRLRDDFPYSGELDPEEEDYSNILDQMLTHYLLELTEEPDFRECYIPARGNRSALSSLQSLVAERISSSSKAADQASLDFGQELITSPLIPNAHSGRAVILHGEVGVGKTSFLRHCELSLRESSDSRDAVWARVDLLSFQDRAFDPDDVKEMLNLICRRIQEKVSQSTEGLSGKYDPDVWAHLRDIYNSEVRRFQKGRFPDSDDGDSEFLRQAREYVWTLREQDPQEHLLRVIRWLTVNCRLPVIVALDNSDQLGLKFQEFLYTLTETLKSQTSAVVVLVLRTEALSSHVIREHSIASVREQFLVEKAPLSAILKKRFSNLMEKLPRAFPGSPEKAARDRIIVLMETFEYEGKLGSDAFRLIDAAGNGNLRDNLRAISAVFRSSPKAMDALVYKQAEDGKSRVSLALVLRALMRDDLRNSDKVRLIPNIFEVDGQITMPYSLGIRQLQQVRAKEAQLAYNVAALLNDFSVAGVDRSIAERALLRMRADRLLAVSHMLPNLRESDEIKLTRLGAILLDVILKEQSYYSRSAFSTYIYRKDIYYDMRSVWVSQQMDYFKKFEAIAKFFIALVADDDEDFQRRIDPSVLEPVATGPLPGLLGASS